MSEALGGNCATTVLATLRLGEWERSAAVMDLVGAAGRGLHSSTVQLNLSRF